MEKYASDKHAYSFHRERGSNLYFFLSKVQLHCEKVPADYLIFCSSDFTFPFFGLETLVFGLVSGV
jgi:hypothetical protein